MAVVTAVCLLIVFSLSIPLCLGSEPCPAGMYMDVHRAECIQCTVCPVDTIVRIPCRSVSDTVCGPFFEFNFFNNNPERSRKLDVVTSSHQPDISVTPSHQSGLDKVGDTGAVQSNSDRWKELSFGLIAALAAVCSLAILYLIVTHSRQRNGSCKHRSLDDCEAPVVYYHTQLVSQTSQLDNQLRDKLLKPCANAGNVYVTGDGKTAPTPFLLHHVTSPEVEIHKSSRRNIYCCPGDGGKQVTEMLLTHHTCRSDS